jgi:CPA1 family monovalent cation:H+ antiporter
MNNPSLLAAAFIICIASVVVRFIWVFAFAYGTRFFFPSIRARDPYPHWRNIFVISWTGMRGVVTLALALALPVTLTNGEAFPHRDLIIFFSTSVILFTLVLQGLTLPWLTRKLAFSVDEKRMHEEWSARVTGARHALTRLDHLMHDDTVHKPALARIREHYTERLESLGDGPNTPLNSTHAPSLMSHPLLQAENRLWAEVLREERDALLAMRRNYTIGDDVMHDMLQEMDLLSTRFHYEAEEFTEPLASAPEKMRLKECAKHLRDKALHGKVPEEAPASTALIS